MGFVRVEKLPLSIVLLFLINVEATLSLRNSGLLSEVDIFAVRVILRVLWGLLFIVKEAAVFVFPYHITPSAKTEAFLP